MSKFLEANKDEYYLNSKGTELIKANNVPRLNFLTLTKDKLSFYGFTEEIILQRSLVREVEERVYSYTIDKRLRSDLTKGGFRHIYAFLSMGSISLPPTIPDHDAGLPHSNQYLQFP